MDIVLSNIVARITAAGVPASTIAHLIGVEKSYLSMVFNEKKPASNHLIERLNVAVRGVETLIKATAPLPLDLADSIRVEAAIRLMESGELRINVGLAALGS
jgi:methylphosphotriester-DNA--protein-cysteine methyltransferase